ncbi:hypothetical protein KGF54_005193 [Candida jiufengensis]|uniref:uncharacterized protein n=1 Tax=Candida jiufengensis TaxID=497108 RepID=UPI0022244A7E|nr:uncharacterized protein KGF54_005193 [Candida jiufengensis]KAI5950236.1 hypothetical protein KGF54_005193 [Candida jiufengensis]
MSSSSTSPTQPTAISVENDINLYTQSLIQELKTKSSREITKYKITKNDSMKKSIDIILNKLPTNAILFEGFTRDIQKLISIIEIVKQKSKESNKKLHQYNRLFKFQTTFNPYKKLKFDKDVEVVDFSNEIEVKASIETDGINENLRREAELEVKGEKLFNLPVLYILLTFDDGFKEYLDNNWTIQQ